MKVKFAANQIDTILRKVTDYVQHGNSYVLDLHKTKKHRSIQQNRFYWGVVVSLFSQSTGYTSEEAHQTLSGIHLKYEKDGKCFVRSTTNLNTLEFEQYMEKCRVFMWHELNIHVPLPNEVSDEFLIQMENIYHY